MDNKNSQYLLGLSAFPKFGPAKLARIRQFFQGDWRAGFEATLDSLLAAGVDEATAKEFIAARPMIQPEAIAERLAAEKIRFISIDDEGYPARLAEIFNPPMILYFRGNLDSLDSFPVAIVGSRKSTIYGRQVAERLAGDLARNGLAIVSGLALGIDTYAHSATLAARGKTIAVLGCGPDWSSLYPTSNRRLAEEIITGGGAVISEFPLGMSPLKMNFPQRNRIISGLSLGVIVVEAEEKSGALITARFALEQGREVMAVPGNIFSSFSSGPNRLLKDGATIITKAQDVLDCLDLGKAESFAENRQILPATEQEKLIIGHLGDIPTHINEIVRLTSLDTSVINSTLTIMEMKGLVKNLGGMKYIIANK